MTIQIERWLDAALVAIEESAPILGFDVPERGVRVRCAAPDLFGAFVSVTGDVTSIQVGFLADSDAHAALARTMLALEEGDELEESDIRDAVRELTNVIAGVLKRRMIEHDPGLRIGLPVFVHGALEKTSRLELALQHLNMCGKRVALVVLQGAGERSLLPPSAKARNLQ